MESFVITVTIVSFFIPIIFTTINPFPFQKETAEDAKKRGWNSYIILITRACSFLTLYTQFWIIIAMLYLTPTTMFIGQSLSWIVFSLYHGMNYIDPMLLAYHPEEFVREVIRWTPPTKKRYTIIWAGLHLQHTVFPFYLHYLTFKHEIDYKNNLFAVVSSFNVVLFYVAWHLCCWHVQGIPSYPFLKKLRIDKYELLFYCGGFIYMVVINCILASMWRELLFYLLGLICMTSITCVTILELKMIFKE